MYRVAKDQIEMTLVFETMAACAALVIAAVIKGLGLIWPVCQRISFLNAWLWPFVVLSAVVVLLNIWGFVGKIKDLKKLARKFGTSPADVAEAIYVHGLKQIIMDSFQNQERGFRAWLDDKRS